MEMMTKSYNIFICLIFSLILKFNFSTAQEISDIIGQYYEKTGGIDRWRSLNSAIITLKSIHSEDMSKGSAERTAYVVKIVSKKESRIYERWLSMDDNDKLDTFSSCYNGENYWIHRKGKPAESFPFYAQHYGKHVRISDPLFLSSSDSIRLLSKQNINVNNRLVECYVIEFSVGGSLYNYFLNCATFLLEGYSKKSGGHNLTTFSDYRLIDGYLFPFKETTINEFKTSDEIQYISVQLNLKVADSVFDYPKSQMNILNKPTIINQN